MRSHRRQRHIFTVTVKGPGTLRVVLAAVVCVVAGSNVSAAPANAGLPRARLDYDRAVAALDCPQRAVFEAAVQSRLGRDPFSEDADTTVLVRVERARDGRFHGWFRLRAAEGAPASGERHLHVADCAELLEHLALGVAVLMDPLAIVMPTQARVVDVAPPRAPDAPPPPGRAPTPPHGAAVSRPPIPIVGAEIATTTTGQLSKVPHTSDAQLQHQRRSSGRTPVI
jgi:hypothetical protein